MFDFKRVEENDEGFTATLEVDDFVYSIFWSSWAVFACKGHPDYRVPIEAIYFDPV